MQGISVGIILAIALIVFLEIFMFFRRIINASREIYELKKKVKEWQINVLLNIQ